MRRALLCLLLSACGSTPVVVPTVTRHPVEVVPPHAAYAVYFDDATLVLPVHPGREVALVDGFLVQDDEEGMDHAVSHIDVRDAIAANLRCPCASVEGACDLDAAPLVARAQRLDGEVVVHVNERPSEELDEEESCDDFEESSEVVGLFGGELFVDVEFGPHGCDESASTEIVSVAVVASPPGIRSIDGDPRCVRGLVFDPMDLTRGRRLECSAPEGDDVDACAACEHTGDSFPSLSRGQVFMLAPSESDYEEVTSVTSEPASADTCPSVNDPCGDPAGLPIPSGASFWVANGGASALVQHGDRWLVVVRGADTASMIYERPRGEPIGVRYHADARPLFAEIDAPTLSVALRRALVLERPIARTDACTTDEQCVNAGFCSSGFCGADHRCHSTNEACDATHECSDAESVCSFGRSRCVDPDSLAPTAADPVAPSDQRLARTPPRDHGLEWVKRCERHLARGAIDHAQTACLHVMAAQPSSAIEARAMRVFIEIAARRDRDTEASVFRMHLEMVEEAIEEEEEASAPPPPRRRRQ